MGSAVQMTPAQEVHHIVVSMVQARRDEGAERAICSVARELGLSKSRVTQILRGNVRRFWADEYLAARERYARFCARQAAALALEAETLRLLAEKYEEPPPCSLSD